jgi:sugar/nucleoside kinase (ribokinase family)
MTVLVTGWVAIDDIETPFAKVESSLGGSATCAALAASLFSPVRLLAVVGEDFPGEFRQRLERPGLDLSGLTIIPGGKTSRWGARYHYDMNSRDTWYPELGVSVAHLPDPPAAWADSSALCLAAGHPAYQRRLIDASPAARISLIDTIKMFIDENREELRDTMQAAQFVVMNETEARELTRRPSIAGAARSLLAGGAENVIIKLGEYGAAFAGQDDYFVAPGYPLEAVVDPTGAGDAFAGGFMGYLDSVETVTTAEVRRAVIYGSTCASFCVEGFGPSRLLTLTREEVESRYREFRMLTHFEVGE